MASILAIIRGLYCDQLKCIYFKNETIFSRYFIAFLESTSNYERFEKKSLMALVISKLITPKNVVT